MAANRCSSCGLNWPVSDLYQPCPKCQCATSHMPHQQPMDGTEAASLVSHIKFERFLADETPEDRRAREAAQAAEEEAAIARLEAIVNGQTNPEPQEAT